MFAQSYIENKLEFYPEIREAVAFGDVFREFVVAHDQYRSWLRSPTGPSAMPSSLRILPGARRQRAQVYAMIEERVDAVSRALKPRAGHGWRADQALLDSAQGARP